MARGVKGTLDPTKSKQIKLFPKAIVGVSLESDMSERLSGLGRTITEQALRSAAHRGSVVFYNELKIRAPLGATGTLRDSVYRWHDYLWSTPTRQTYRVGVNTGKAGHWYQVEYGHWRVNVIVNGIPTKKRLKVPVWTPPTPYLRPTYAAKAQVVVETMRARLAELTADALQGKTIKAPEETFA